MPVSERESERRVALLTEELRRSGHRLTHQRLEVARELAGNETHPDVESVYRAVRQKVPTISLDTVYRTVAALADLGVVRRVGVLTGSMRYDANPEQHHHFVCTRCGLIQDVYSLGLDELRPPDETSALGTVEVVKVQFRGICKSCEPGGTR